MKTQKLKSLKLVKASIASLDKREQNNVVGGFTRIGDCNSRTSLCITSCHVH
jgi:natural product precursor